MLTFTLARWRSVASSVGHEIRIHCSCLARQSIYPTWSAASDFHEWKQVHLPDESPVAREPTAAGSDDTQQLDSQRRRGVLRTRATEVLKGVVHNGDVSVREDFEFSSYRKLELLQRLRQMGRRLEWRAALKSFRRARSKGLIADDLMYSCIITVMAKSGRWSEALLLLEQAHQDGIAPNKYCYTAAVNACAKGRKSKLATALLQEMRVKGLRPDHVTYGSAITAMAKSGEWERALDLLREMAEEGLQPNVVCFGAAVDACAKGGQWRKAVSLLEEMREAGVEPDRICYNTAVNACAQSGQWEIALSITDKMHCAGEEASRPDAFTLNSVMYAMACVGEWERLLEMLHGMHDVGVVPDVVSYNTAMRACNEAQQNSRALLTFETMLQAGVSPDNESFTAAAEACASDESGRMGARALELLELAREQGFGRPCARVVAASLAACVGGGPWRQAIPTVEDMLQASGRNAWDDVMKFLKGLQRERQDGGFKMYLNTPTLQNFKGPASAATDELSTKGSGGVPVEGETLDEREVALKRNHTAAYIEAPRIASTRTQPDLTSASEQAHAEGVPRDEEGGREQRCGSTVKGEVAMAASFKLGCVPVPAVAQAVTASAGAAIDHSFKPWDA